MATQVRGKQNTQDVDLRPLVHRYNMGVMVGNWNEERKLLTDTENAQERGLLMKEKQKTYNSSPFVNKADLDLPLNDSEYQAQYKGNQIPFSNIGVRELETQQVFTQTARSIDRSKNPEPVSYETTQKTYGKHYGRQKDSDPSSFTRTPTEYKRDTIFGQANTLEDAIRAVDELDDKLHNLDGLPPTTTVWKDDHGDSSVQTHTVSGLSRDYGGGKMTMDKKNTFSQPIQEYWHSKWMDV